jgi:sugar/nucleoside kinase (ribokinase family)
MKFTVIGHLCSDIVHLPEGNEVRSYGGILYAVTTLAALAGEGHTIFPIFGAGKTDEEQIRSVLSRYPGIDQSGIFTLNGETNEVHLFYDENQHRLECSKNISDPIPFSAIEPYLSVNGILINLISGFDIVLETLDLIRLGVRSKNVPIHLDLHSATLGIDGKGTRFRRPLADWRRWCFMINSVQMNEEEAAGLAIDKHDEESLAKQMLPLMVNGFIITRGERGATMFRQDHKTVFRDDVQGAVAGPVVDVTGCGDIFGAAFIYSFCRTKKFTEALDYANSAAGITTAASGLGKVDVLSRWKENDPT